MRKAVLMIWSAMLLVLSAAMQVNGQQTLQQRDGLPAFFEMLNAGMPVSVVYLGGSITQAPGYRVKSAEWLKKQYPKSVIQTVNAGVGGTGSDLGVFRLKDDVLAHKPNLVFLEFAVNDYGTDSVRTAKAMEGIIRQIKSANPHTDICLLYSISEAMLGDYLSGHLPGSIRVMERLAAHYGLPSINFAFDILAMQKSGQLIFKGTKTGTIPKKVVFTADGTHPLDAGHDLYFSTLKGSMVKMAGKNHKPFKGKFKLAAPLHAGFYKETGRYLPAKFSWSAGWQQPPDTALIKGFVQSLPGLCYSENESDSLVLEFTGTGFGLEDVIGPASNGFSIGLDGGALFKIIRFDKYCSRYRRHYFLIDTLTEGKHRVVIRPDFSPIDKLSILKPEDRQLFSQTADQIQRAYIGSVLIAGRPLLE